MMGYNWKFWLKVVVLAMGSAGAMPVHADDLNDDEKLVMRLIFEECTGWVQDGEEPFQTMETRAIDEQVRKAFEPPPSVVATLTTIKIVDILSPRHKAIWLEGVGFRLCAIVSDGKSESDWDGNSSAEDLRFIVDQDFLDHVDRRAKHMGLIMDEHLQGLWVGPDYSIENLPYKGFQIKVEVGSPVFEIEDQQKAQLNVSGITVRGPSR